MRVAVVGHVEWITFARVDHVPGPGEIAHATDTWEGPGGAGGVAAVQLAKLAGSCDLFTVFGRDDIGEQATATLLSEGVEVRAALRDEATRRAVALIGPTGERTITTLGPRLQPNGADPLPWDRLGDSDAVYVTAGDVGAIRHARRGRVMVVTTRHLATLAASGVAPDAVVGSARDPAERYDPQLLATSPPRLVVLTEGAEGGRFQTADGEEGRYEAAPLPGPIVDTYGGGDSFHAGLTFALGAGLDIPEALALAARCGAGAVAGRGPTGGQLTAADL